MCVSIYICVLRIACSMCLEEEIEVNSVVCEDGAKICMEEWSEVNSCGGDDKANYPDYKLYAVNHEFSCLCVVFGCWKYMMSVWEGK